MPFPAAGPFGNRGLDRLQSRRLETGGLAAAAALDMHSNTVSTATVRGGLQNSDRDAVRSLEIVQGCDVDRAGCRGEGVVAGMLVVAAVVVYVLVVDVPVLDPVDTAARQTV